MKAFLINPTLQTIEEVDYSGNIKYIYRLLDCKAFDVVSIDADNDLYIDDEGLLVNPDFQDYFAFNGGLFAGKGLILGCDTKGNTIQPNIDIITIKNKTKFIPKEYAIHLMDNMG